MMGMFDRQRIPKSLISNVVKRDVDFDPGIGTLHGFSLIAKNIGGETFAIHRLVQLCIHQWLEHEKQKVRYAGRVLQLFILSRNINSDIGRLETTMYPDRRPCSM